MATKKSNANVKKRNWAFIVYPTKQQMDLTPSKYDGSVGYGTAPDDWQEQIQKTGLQAAISPLHDCDLNPDNSVKKPHYHVIITYSGPTSFSVVKTITDRLNAPIPQALEQIRGYYRYLTHADNPEKYQYSVDDIRTINGFDIADFVELTRSEINVVKKRLQELIRDRQITEYAELMDLLFDENLNPDWEIAATNTYFFDKYISSIRNRQPKTETKKPQKIDLETGEILE